MKTHPQDVTIDIVLWGEPIRITVHSYSGDTVALARELSKRLGS